MRSEIFAIFSTLITFSRIDLARLSLIFPFEASRNLLAMSLSDAGFSGSPFGTLTTFVRVSLFFNLMLIFIPRTVG